MNSLKSNNLLTWYDRTIPENEIWVKIGGDHGRGSFKLTMQVANVSNQNSKTNTKVFAFGRVTDTHENLRKMMLYFNEEVLNIQGMIWDNKTIEVLYLGKLCGTCLVYIYTQFSPSTFVMATHCAGAPC